MILYQERVVLNSKTTERSIEITWEGNIIASHNFLHLYDDFEEGKRDRWFNSNGDKVLFLFYQSVVSEMDILSGIKLPIL